MLDSTRNHPGILILIDGHTRAYAPSYRIADSMARDYRRRGFVATVPDLDPVPLLELDDDDTTLIPSALGAPVNPFPQP